LVQSSSAADEDWKNVTLEYFRVQQQTLAAFASRMHSRLGEAPPARHLIRNHHQRLLVVTTRPATACCSQGVM
jgi:hypothetical protein